MKFLILGVFLALAAVHGMPAQPAAKEAEAEIEWGMVPDEFGWKLVNVNEDPEPERFYNPETDIIFTLFTRDNREGQVLQWFNATSITASSFNPNNPTRMTIHGWNGDGRAAVNGRVHSALFEIGDFNCITVDWGAGAQTVNYLAARNRVGPTGEVAGNLLRLINGVTQQPLSMMSAIGHSLGGHVAGFIGKAVNGQLGSVVALDAALPLFNINRPEGRVADTDALYVESHHTNAGLLGFDEPIGHANFYPNFGSSQPGCGIDLGGGCAHGRSNSFYIESITTSVHFYADQCAGGYDDIRASRCTPTGQTSRMGGEPLMSSARGVYYLETAAAAPFALGRRN